VGLHLTKLRWKTAKKGCIYLKFESLFTSEKYLSQFNLQSNGIQTWMDEFH